jgi:hypothetical protein
MAKTRTEAETKTKAENGKWILVDNRKAAKDPYSANHLLYASNLIIWSSWLENEKYLFDALMLTAAFNFC